MSDQANISKFFDALVKLEISLANSCMSLLPKWSKFHDCHMKKVESILIEKVSNEPDIKSDKLNTWFLTGVIRGLYGYQLKHVMEFYPPEQV